MLPAMRAQAEHGVERVKFFLLALICTAFFPVLWIAIWLEDDLSFRDTGRTLMRGIHACFTGNEAAAKKLMEEVEAREKARAARP